MAYQSLVSFPKGCNNYCYIQDRHIFRTLSYLGSVEPDVRYALNHIEHQTIECVTRYPADSFENINSHEFVFSKLLSIVQLCFCFNKKRNCKSRLAANDCLKTLVGCKSAIYLYFTDF